jgi:hypothetical protein
MMKCILKKKSCEGAGCTKMAQDMFHWHALLNMLINFSITQEAENFLNS